MRKAKIAGTRADEQTLQDKIEHDLARNISELMRATGYGRVQIKRIDPPLVEGKVRLSDFCKHCQTLQSTKPRPTKATATMNEPPTDIQLMVANLRASKKSIK